MTAATGFALPKRPVSQARKLFVVANAYAIALFVALAVRQDSAGGAWAIAGLGALDALGNVAITALIMQRIGYRRAEDLRAGFNVAVLGAVAWLSGWHLLAWMFLPFMTSLAGVPKAGGGGVRVVAIVAGFDGLATATGGVDVTMAAFSGLSVFVYLMIGAHLAFAERMLAERDRTLAALTQARAAAMTQERLASIGQLAAGIAHEINNPMCFVTANVDDLLADLRAEPTLAPRLMPYRDEILPETVGGIARVNSIVGDLRRFARGEPAARVDFDLSDEIAAAVRMARTQLQPRQALVATVAAGLRLRGLPRQLGQVALNLITNALAAIEAGGTVTVSLGRRGDAIELVVVDDGVGMTAALQARIFEPFFTTRPPGRGMGLGLAVVHGVVTAHGGEVEVDSAPGRGARVTVRLPG